MTQKIIPKKVFKNSHVKIDIIDALLLQNIKNILIRRYPEAEVSINYGQITIKKNLLDRLYIKVFEDRQKNSSYIQTSYADTTSTIGYYYIGLLPNLIIIFLQMVLGRQFKEEVTETILRDLKTKYRTDIQYIDRPIGTIELFLYGLVGVNLVVFLCDYLSINNPFFSFFGWGDYLIVSNPIVQSLFPHLNASVLWFLFCLFVWIKCRKVSSRFCLAYFTSILVALWVISVSCGIHIKIVGYDTDVKGYNSLTFGEDESEHYEKPVTINGKEMCTTLDDGKPATQFIKGYAKVQEYYLDDDGVLNTYGPYHIINEDFKCLASGNCHLIDVVKLSNDRILITEAYDYHKGCAVLNNLGEQIIGYKEYDYLWQLNGSTLVGERDGKNSFLNYDGKEVSTLATIEYSSNAIIWITHIIIYLLFVLSLFKFTQNCKKS